MLSLAEYSTLTNNPLKADYFITEALSQFSHYYSMKHIIDCELLRCYEYIRQNLLLEVSVLLERLSTKLNHSDPYHQRATLFNLYGDYFVILEDYDSAEKMYLQATLNNEFPSETILSLIKLYYHSSQTSKLNGLLAQLEQKKFDFKHENHLKHQYYYYLIHHPNSELFRIFLLKKAIPFAQKQHDYQGFKLFLKTLSQLYITLHKYKEAVQILVPLYETIN